MISIQRSLAWYQKKFPLIITIGLAVFIAIFIEKIPYLNLFSTYLGTVSLTFVLAICVVVTKNNNSTNLKILISLLLLSYLLNILTFSYQSEMIGNLFYIQLFYVTITQALALRKKIHA